MIAQRAGGVFALQPTGAHITEHCRCVTEKQNKLIKTGFSAINFFSFF